MVSALPRIVFVDDDTRLLDGLYRALRSKRHQWQMSFINDPTEMIPLIEDGAVDVLITDLAMPEMHGRDLIAKVKRIAPDLPCIVLSGTADLTSAAELVNSVQPFRLLLKPQTSEDLVRAIQDALEAIKQLELHSEADQGDAVDQRILNRLRVGVIVTDAAGRVRTMNQIAATCLAQAHILSLDSGGVLRTRHLESKQTLAKLIEDAAHGREEAGEAGAAITLEADDGISRLQLHLSRFSDAERDGDSTTLIFVNDPDDDPPLTTAQIAQLLGLTKTEAALVHSLTMGLSLEQAAEIQSVTVSSARTYLKRIYSKTGTNRQSDLIRLVLSGGCRPLSGPALTGAMTR